MPISSLTGSGTGMLRVYFCFNNGFIGLPAFWHSWHVFVSNVFSLCIRATKCQFFPLAFDLYLGVPSVVIFN